MEDKKLGRIALWTVDEKIKKNIPQWKINQIIKQRERRRKIVEDKLKNQEAIQEPTIGYKVIVNEEGKKIIAIDEYSSMVVKEFFNYYLNNNHLSSNECSRYISDKYSNEQIFFIPFKLAKTLKNSFYIGIITLNKYISLPHSYPLFIDKDLWDKCQDRPYIKKESKKDLKKPDLLFRSILKCSVCGNKSHATGKNEITYYTCRFTAKDERHDGFKKSIREDYIVINLMDVLNRFDCDMNVFRNNYYKRTIIISLIFKQISYKGDILKYELNNELADDDLRSIISILCKSQPSTDQLVNKYQNDKILIYLSESRSIEDISEFLKKDLSETQSIIMDYQLQDLIIEEGGLWRTKH